MIIIACVKNREPSFYLKNCSLVTLIFKDKVGLANHPMSCHPQGVFGSRESGRKGEKMSGKTLAQCSICKMQKMKKSSYKIFFELI